MVMDLIMCRPAPGTAFGGGGSSAAGRRLNTGQTGGRMMTGQVGR